MNSRCVFLEARDITAPGLKDFAAYWRGKMSGGRLPHPSAIDPPEITGLLPFIVIAQLEAAPLRVRYRLVGTRVVEAHGADYTNRYLDECGFLIEAELTECYRRLSSQRIPIFMYYEWERHTLPRTRSILGASESGFFPLSSDGITVDRAISFADPSVAPRGLALKA
ncbi:MAG TPA: PAS domain-containing protein [Alphaproteobacteria bacterium]|nr:PAS domain-containing protein [Alphaproteobacteria bacterium]